jgi:hypothetical protein
MFMYGFYNYWRYKSDAASFALYIISATVYSTYACGWVRAAFAFSFGPNLNITQDYLTDWSVLRVHAKYPLLRDELLCADYPSVSEHLKELT